MTQGDSSQAPVMPAKPLDVTEAWRWTVKNFPFPGYIVARRRPAYEGLVRQLLSVIPPEARVLDFGAGPADKTALFSLAGYDVVAYDDFQDPWHLVDDNIDRIVRFARTAGVDYRVGADPFALLEGERFDVIMLHHVLEHLHDSPKGLLLRLLEHLRPGGFVYITVPNAVNIRKRMAVALGQTNYPSFPSFYWYPGEFRGHVREYVKSDLAQLAEFLDLRPVKLVSYFHFPHVLPRPVLKCLDFAASVAPGWRDSWMLIAERPESWSPQRHVSGGELVSRLGRGEYYDYSKFEPDPQGEE